MQMFGSVPYEWPQKGRRGQKAVVLRAKIIQFLRETYVQDSRYTYSRRWSRQLQNSHDSRLPSSQRVTQWSLKPRQGRRVRQMSRAKLSSRILCFKTVVKLQNWRNLFQDFPSCRRQAVVGVSQERWQLGHLREFQFPSPWQWKCFSI